jgi:hypothetical protein
MLDLKASLFIINLIDANRINPHHSRLIRLPQMHHGEMQTLGDLECLPIQLHWFLELVLAPGVG